jgi:predicted glycogen debranching enzyme
MMSRGFFMPDISIDQHTEWLEANGLGGFAMGTTSGVRTRRYHGLLVTATTPPSGRLMLINGFDAWAVVGGQKVDLSSQQYGGDVLHPDGSKRIVQFEDDPWPTWTYRLPGGIELTQEIFVPHGSSAVVINFRCADRSVPIKIYLRPFLSVRDFHALHHENSTFKFDHYEAPGCVKWRPYKGLPQIVTRTSAHYTHDPQWYRNFSYAQEKARGLDSNEDEYSADPDDVFHTTLYSRF